MFTVMLFGALFVVAMLVVGVLVAVMSVLGFVITLPLRILGWTLKLVGLALFLPLLLVAGLLAGGGVLVALMFGLLLPLAPIVGLAWLAWYLATRGGKRSQARVVS
ncbi:MAG: hypothetical protein IT347_08405 [Candidatus Eisenbacteria bacterium]|nr:hypothetical protein [Candidatus Eisenbacteria bacterium]